MQAASRPLSFTVPPSGPVTSLVESLRAEARRDIQGLPGVLCWEETGTSSSAGQHLLKVWTETRLRLWKSKDTEGLVSRVFALPQDSRHRILLSPRFFSVLREISVPTESTWDMLRSFVAVEELLIGRQGEVEEQAWSALGDVRILNGTPVSALKSHELVFDGVSPHVCAGWMKPTDQQLSAEELESMRTRVETCLNWIQMEVPAARKAISSAVKVLYVLKETEQPDQWMSMSTERSIGGILIKNLHTPATWSDSLIMESLIHETIHSLIYPAELFQSLYTDVPSSYELKVRSSWTGRELQLHSFVHACFVWFGLANFWKRVSHGQHSNPARLETALSGFQRAEIEDLVPKEARAVLQPFAWSLLQQMFTMARSQ